MSEPQRLRLHNTELKWSYRNEGSGYLYFTGFEDQATNWEFSPSLETDLRQLDRKLLEAASFYNKAHPNGVNIFGSRWEPEAIMVTEGQIMIARRVEQPNVIYAIKFEKQRPSQMVINYVSVEYQKE